MAAGNESGPGAGKNPTTVERKSDRELVATRTFNAPARLVFEAWSKPELFSRWWLPKSFGISVVSCQMDVRTGGSYKLELKRGDAPAMTFFGRYLEVVPNARIVWTNEEGGESGQVTTVTFQEKDGKTVVAMSDLFPSKEAADEAIASGSTSGTDETFEQLHAFLAGKA